MTAIAPERPTDTDLDLSDLDLLDDDRAHAACNGCYPHEDAPYAKFTGICGAESSMLGPMTNKRCQKCLELSRTGGPCPKCGLKWN